MGFNSGFKGLTNTPSSKWVPGGRGVRLTTNLHLVPKGRMRGTVPPLSHTSSCRCA